MDTLQLEPCNTHTHVLRPLMAPHTTPRWVCMCMHLMYLVLPEHAHVSPTVHAFVFAAAADDLMVKLKPSAVVPALSAPLLASSPPAKMMPASIPGTSPIPWHFRLWHGADTWPLCRKHQPTNASSLFEPFLKAPFVFSWGNRALCGPRRSPIWLARTFGPGPYLTDLDLRS